MEKYAESLNGIYRCVSALNSYGIKELFEYIAKTLFNKNKKEIKIPLNNKENISLNSNDIQKKKKTHCCKGK